MWFWSLSRYLSFIVVGLLDFIQKSHGELASYQKKLIQIDDHIGIAIAGLTSDARVLSTFMRSKALASKINIERNIPVGRLANEVAAKAQENTMVMGGRPYGVGLLVAGVDDNGTHLYEFSPSGTCFKYHAMAMGARSQSARTYLEKHFDSFPQCPLEELIVHGLKALKDTIPTEKNKKEDANWLDNVSVGIVGVEVPFYVLEGEELRPFLGTQMMETE